MTPPFPLSSAKNGRRWYFLIGVLLGLVLMVVIKNFAIHSYMEGKLSDYFGAEVNIDDVNAGISTVTLKKVQLSHPINPTLNVFEIDEVQMQHSLYSWLVGDMWQIDELVIIGIKDQAQRKNLATLTRYLTTVVKPETKADPARLSSLFQNVEKSRRNLLVQNPKLQDSVQFDQIRQLYHNIEDWEYRLQTTVASVVSLEAGVNPDKQRMSDLAADLNRLKKEQKELDRRAKNLKLNYQQKLWDSYVVDVDNVNLKEIDNILWSKLIKDQLDKIYIPVEYVFSQFRPKGSSPIKFRINTAKIAPSEGYTYQVKLNNFQSWYEKPEQSGSLLFSQFKGDAKVYELALDDFNGVASFDPIKVNLAVESTQPRSYKLVDLKNRKLAMTWPKQQTRVTGGKVAMSFFDPQFSQTGFAPSTQQLILKTLQEASPLTVDSTLSKKDGFVYFSGNSSNFTANLTHQTTEDLSSSNKQNTKRLQSLARQQLQDIKSTLRENLVAIEKRHYANIKLKPKAGSRSSSSSQAKANSKKADSAKRKVATAASRKPAAKRKNTTKKRQWRVVNTRNGPKKITIASRAKPKLKPKANAKAQKARAQKASTPARKTATRIQSSPQIRASSSAKASSSSAARSATQTRAEAKRKALAKLKGQN